MLNKTWTPVAMIQECIEGKRVMVQGLYAERENPARTVVVDTLVMGKSVVHVCFHQLDSDVHDNLSVKKFYKKYRLTGI